MSGMNPKLAEGFCRSHKLLLLQRFSAFTLDVQNLFLPSGECLGLPCRSSFSLKTKLNLSVHLLNLWFLYIIYFFREMYVLFLN